jgi:RecB family exonuclease
MTPDRVTRRRPASQRGNPWRAVSYRALAAPAENTRESQASHAEIQAIEATLAKLRAPGN